MLAIPRRYSHFIFAVIQAGLTCLIAAGIASLPLVTLSQFLIHWLLSWLVSWLTHRRQEVERSRHVAETARGKRVSAARLTVCRCPRRLPDARDLFNVWCCVVSGALPDEAAVHRA